MAIYCFTMRAGGLNYGSCMLENGVVTLVCCKIRKKGKVMSARNNLKNELDSLFAVCVSDTACYCCHHYL